MGTAVIYARYSSGKQREASIEDQLRVCRDWCRKEGYTVAREYWDKAISGRTDARPWFQAMVRNAPESDIVLVYAMDRFSRDQYDAPIYKKSLAECGVRVVSATENIDSTPEGVFMEKIMEGWAAYYSLNLSRSVTRGMTGNAMKCKWNGVPVYGYSVNDDGLYEIEHAEADVVREVFERYAKGEPLHAVAAELAERGAKNRKGLPIDKDTLYRIVHNRKYIGEYRWGGVVVPGGMPRIVDDALFDAAQASVPRKRRKTEKWSEYRLTGKLWCGLCGKPMRGLSGRGCKGVKYDYYACPTRKCVKNAPKEMIERAIVGGVNSLMGDADVAMKIAERACECYDTSPIDAKIATAKKALEGARRGISGIEDAICAGIVTDGLRERLSRFNEEIARLEPEVERLEREKNEVVDANMVADFLRFGLSGEDPSLVLESFIEKAVLFEDGIVLTMSFMDVEMGEPAVFSLVGSEFSQIVTGSPDPMMRELGVCLIPGGIAIRIPRCA